ncbi:SPOR domain-containing protein [Noviherbaspirillum agri]
MHNYNRQQGGTLVGLIIGLIVGLGIALGVAMVITKTPMPFTDKSGRQKASSPTANQTSDPNKPMYGNKAAIKDAARDFAKEPAPTNTAAPQPTSDKIVEVKADAKPADSKAQAAVPGKDGTAKVESTEDKWIYYLQAGAFRESTDAEGIRAKLALIGVEAKISERQSETGVLYRVRVGPFAQLDAMNRVRGKLSDNGVDAAVVRVAK